MTDSYATMSTAASLASRRVEPALKPRADREFLRLEKVPSRSCSSARRASFRPPHVICTASCTSSRCSSSCAARSTCARSTSVCAATYRRRLSLDVEDERMLRAPPDDRSLHRFFSFGGAVADLLFCEEVLHRAFELLLRIEIPSSRACNASIARFMSGTDRTPLDRLGRRLFRHDAQCSTDFKAFRLFNIASFTEQIRAFDDSCKSCKALYTVSKTIGDRQRLGKSVASSA